MVLEPLGQQARVVGRRWRKAHIAGGAGDVHAPVVDGVAVPMVEGEDVEGGAALHAHVDHGAL